MNQTKCPAMKLWRKCSWYSAQFRNQRNLWFPRAFWKSKAAFQPQCMWKKSTAVPFSYSRTPSPAAHNNQLKWGDQLATLHLHNWVDWRKKGPLQNQSLYSLQSAQWLKAKKCSFPPLHTLPFLEWWGRLKFEQTVKLEEHSYFWASPKSLHFGHVPTNKSLLSFFWW